MHLVEVTNGGGRGVVGMTVTRGGSAGRPRSRPRAAVELAEGRLSAPGCASRKKRSSTPRRSSAARHGGQMAVTPTNDVEPGASRSASTTSWPSTTSTCRSNGEFSRCSVPPVAGRPRRLGSSPGSSSRKRARSSSPGRTWRACRPTSAMSTRSSSHTPLPASERAGQRRLRPQAARPAQARPREQSSRGLSGSFASNSSSGASLASFRAGSSSASRSPVRS